MDDKLKNNRLSDDDLDKVNGGTEYSPTSPEAAMIFKGECPECYKRSRGTELGELVDRGSFYTCTQCGSYLYISF